MVREESMYHLKEIMKNILTILCVLFSCVMLLFSCSNTSPSLEENYSVSGYVYQQGIPVADVTISIDEIHNYTVQSDEQGFFKINNVSVGNHQLRIYKSFTQQNETQMIVQNSDDAFSERTFDIQVTGDIVLSSLILPKPVKLYKPKIDRNIVISWSSSDAEDFREYKLYRHNSSGLDETTGELIHISTSILDTVFIDEDIISFQEYYYRIYIMNEYGKLGGSNIVSIKTENSNLFSDGSFETDIALDYWGLHADNYTYLDSTIYKDGKYSLHLIRDTTDIYSSRTITHQKFLKVGIGEEYVFSFWFRVKGEPSECSDVIVNFGDAFQHSETYPMCEGVNYQNEQWLYYERTFECNDSFVLYIYFDTFSDLWIDSLELIRKEYIQ